VPSAACLIKLCWQYKACLVPHLVDITSCHGWCNALWQARSGCSAWSSCLAGVAALIQAVLKRLHSSNPPWDQPCICTHLLGEVQSLKEDIQWLAASVMQALTADDHQEYLGVTLPVISPHSESYIWNTGMAAISSARQILLQSTVQIYIASSVCMTKKPYTREPSWQDAVHRWKRLDDWCWLTLLICCDEQPELHSLVTPDFCSQLSSPSRCHKHELFPQLLAWFLILPSSPCHDAGDHDNHFRCVYCIKSLLEGECLAALCLCPASM